MLHVSTKSQARRVDWMASDDTDVIDAEFTLHADARGQPNLFALASSLKSSKNVAIDSKCLDNHGGTLYS